MRATHCIRGRVAAVKWRGWRKHRLWIVHGMGETFEVTANTQGGSLPQIGSEVFILDTDDTKVFLGVRPKYRRLYANFARHNLEPEGNYGVWLGSAGLHEEQLREFECLSSMVDDWFTVVDDVDLNLLRIQCGGQFAISNDTILRL